MNTPPFALSNKAVSEFSNIFKEHFAVQLTDTDAETYAGDLIELLWCLCSVKNLNEDKNEYKKTQSRKINKTL